MHLVPVCYSLVSGGAELYLRLLYPQLDALGHSTRLIGSVPGWGTTGLPSTPVAFGPKWSSRTIVKRLPRLPYERRAVERLVSGTSVDIFHTQFKREQIGLTDVLARTAPVVWTEHGTFPTGARGRVLAAAYRQAAKRVSAIICVSQDVADDVRGIVGASVRIEMIPNAIDTDACSPPTEAERRQARDELDLPHDVPVLAWVGRLDHGKLPLLAVATGKHFPGITLIAGDGPLAGAVGGAADGDRVRYVGFLPDPTLLYRAADVFLFTSTGAGEGAPYTLLEAAAHGLPIVANAPPGTGSAFREAGHTVSGDDPPQLAQAAVRAAADGLSQSSREWAIRHDIKAWARAHADVMENARAG